MHTNSTARTTRLDRARLALQGADDWLRIRDNDGKPLAFGIPSAKHPQVYYATNLSTCTCPDATINGAHCYHMISVKLYVDLKKAERKAASYAF